MIFTFTPFIVAFWAWQEKRGIEPSTLTKMALGCFCTALSYLIMAGAAWVGGRQFGELVVAVRLFRRHHHRRALSLSHRVIARSKIAPARMISTTMGLWLGTSFIGNSLRLARQLLSSWTRFRTLRGNRRRLVRLAMIRIMLKRLTRPGH